jgi:hypothetical protein
VLLDGVSDGCGLIGRAAAGIGLMGDSVAGSVGGRTLMMVFLCERQVKRRWGRKRAGNSFSILAQVHDPIKLENQRKVDGCLSAEWHVTYALKCNYEWNRPNCSIGPNCHTWTTNVCRS